MLKRKSSWSEFRLLPACTARLEIVEVLAQTAVFEGASEVCLSAAETACPSAPCANRCGCSASLEDCQCWVAERRRLSMVFTENLGGNVQTRSRGACPPVERRPAHCLLAQQGRAWQRWSKQRQKDAEVRRSLLFPLCRRARVQSWPKAPGETMPHAFAVVPFRVQQTSRRRFWNQVRLTGNLVCGVPIFTVKVRHFWCTDWFTLPKLHDYQSFGCRQETGKVGNNKVGKAALS